MFHSITAGIALIFYSGENGAILFGYHASFIHAGPVR